MLVGGEDAQVGALLSLMKCSADVSLEFLHEKVNGHSMDGDVTKYKDGKKSPQEVERDKARECSLAVRASSVGLYLLV